MRKLYYVATASILTVMAVLAVNILIANTKLSLVPISSKSARAGTGKIIDSNVLTWDCENKAYKPETIVLTCADGGLLVHQITWQTWTRDEATGVGFLSKNMCDPNCAEGERVRVPVRLMLSEKTSHKDRFYFRSLDIRTKDKHTFPWTDVKEMNSDVMEFAEITNWRS
jgi:hypothetical protein